MSPCDSYDHRTRGTLRFGATASTAWPCRARFGRLRLSIVVWRTAKRDCESAPAYSGETEDGFRIAEEDLKLRSGGEILKRVKADCPNSGLRILVYTRIYWQRRDDAKLILSQDKNLPRNAKCCGAALLI